MTDERLYRRVCVIAALTVLGSIVFATYVHAQDINGPYTLADTDEDEDYPDIAVDSDGYPHIAFENWTDALLNYHSDI